jgi:lysophospholipase L1-like esterase
MRLRVRIGFGVLVPAVLAACVGGSATPSRTPAGTPSAPAATASIAAASPSAVASPSGGGDQIVLVALGDSATTGHGDPTGRGWVGYYADDLQHGLGKAIDVRNLAQDGTTSEQLLATVQTDASLRADLAEADIVVIGIGGNDLNEADAALAANECKGTACYDKPAQQYEQNLAAVAKEISDLRSGTPVVLRAVGMPNALTGAEDVIPPFLRSVATKIGAYQALRFDDATCAAMKSAGGACLRVRDAFNGPDGTEDAYARGLMNHDECCYPNQAGQRLIAELLFATGLDALAGAGAP